MNDPVIIGGIDPLLAMSVARLANTELVIVPPPKPKEPEPDKAIITDSLCASTSGNFYFGKLKGNPHLNAPNQPFYAAVSRAKRRP